MTNDETPDEALGPHGSAGAGKSSDLRRSLFVIPSSFGIHHSSFSSNPWPIGIMAFFALFIMFIVAFIVFATRQKIDLVRHDYYEEEVRFQQQLDRLTRTRPVHAEVAVAYDAGHQQITLTLPAAHAHRPATGQIHFYRPSDAGLDRDIELAVNFDGIQEVDAQKLRAGLWKVRVFWNVDGQEYFFDQPIVVGAM